MTEPSDACLHRPGRQKKAGATLYLMEELGDARLRCDQLLRYLEEAVKLIEKSSHKDHFFEVAGHLITNIPDVAFRLQKALQAVALAADRLDYEEIKQELRPEKVEELERVLKDVRIRPVQHRSFPPVGANPMTPKQAATRLREIAKTARENGFVPLNELASLIHALDPKRQAADTTASVSMLDKLADHLEGNTKQTVSRTQLATVLARIGMEAEFNEMLRQATTRSKTALAGGDSNPMLGSFDNMRTMAIQANRMAQGNRWRMALMSLYSIVDEIGTVLVHLGETDTQKSEALKRQIRQAVPAAMHMNREPGFGQDVSVTEGQGQFTASSAEEARRSRFEQGVPADPTENMNPGDAESWKVEHDKHKDNFKEAGFKNSLGEVIESRHWKHKETGATASLYGAVPWSGSKGDQKSDWDLVTVGYTIQWNNGTIGNGRKPFTSEDEAEKYLKSEAERRGKKAEEEKQTKFEEGKPADPTENMSPEDAKAWKVEHNENKDNFKAA